MQFESIRKFCVRERESRVWREGGEDCLCLHVLKRMFVYVRQCMCACVSENKKEG